MSVRSREFRTVFDDAQLKLCEAAGVTPEDFISGAVADALAGLRQQADAEDEPEPTFDDEEPEDGN